MSDFVIDVREHLSSAEEEVKAACRLLHNNGWEDIADQMSAEMREFFSAARGSLPRRFK